MPERKGILPVNSAAREGLHTDHPLYLQKKRRLDKREEEGRERGREGEGAE